MDEQRQEDYLNLINTLLGCTNDEEINRVLDANQNLINPGLVQMMGQVREVLAERGDESAANFLIHLTHQLSKALGLSLSTVVATPLVNSDSQLMFLLQVLQATAESKGNEQVVYALLKANLDKLDDNFTTVLKNWARDTLLEVELAQELAEVISIFSQRICQFPLGIQAVNKEIAIAGYEVVATVFTQEFFLQDWANTKNDIGNVYFERIRGDKAENLEVAISCYLDALQVYSSQAYPEKWASTKNNLGNAYVYRIRGERAKNLEVAITCFLEALAVYTIQDFPDQWAEIKINIGIAYFDRIDGDKAENIEVAIRHYLAALRVFTKQKHPEKWAMVQNNLANAYLHRVRGERAENLEVALHCLLAALEVRPSEALPFEWANIQYNLGNVYLNRIRGERAKNLEAAIHCLLAALEVFTSESFPQYWADIQNSLGSCYFYRIQGEKAENLEMAIYYFQAASEVLTFQSFPLQWADIQNNLGLAYLERVQGERADNLEVSICYFTAALDVLNFESLPQFWADTQHNRGAAYFYRIRGERADNLEAAVRCFFDVLRVCTREAFPTKYARSQFNLGRTYQNIKRFPNAYKAFATAIDTIESLRSEIASGSDKEQDKQKLAEDWNNVYGCIVEICLKLDNATEAIEYVERSKTRHLVELILTRDRHTIFPAEVVAQLDRLRDEIASGQYELQNATAEEPTALAQHLQQLRQQRNELQDRYLPIGSGFQFEPFRSTLSDRTAIVEFYITTDKLLIFIITKQTQQPIVLSPDLIDLNKLANWANSYLKAYSYKKSHWQRRLTTRLHLLAKILHIDEIVQQIPTECDKLILIPHRYLHLLPLHALPLAEDSSLFDRFLRGVSYAPSCQLLQLAQNRQRPEFTHLFAVQNPTGDLSYTDIEVETIQRYFNISNLFKQEIATKEAIDNTSLTLVHCAHFSCHGYFNGTEPRKSALILANAQLNSAPTQPNAENYLSLEKGSLLDLNKCLTLDSIFTLNLEQCRLVTLSACETGLIDFRNTSDEYIGLPSGFLYAGASSVVSSLWTVNDLSTAFLMIRFYQNLQKGLAVGLALNQAQLWLKNLTKGDLEKWIEENQLSLEPAVRLVLRRRLYQLKDDAKPFQSPFYWGAFCAIGQ
ncbi:CHAT domain-containing protein [Aerosakkonemataceae cyanobacterium BLCC-F50]|uniref:CHAT domain-containing protein n=1 Tax=Floridaenema flaviceps BLCC-F50 TaxID=3153642 RepID=A0ABV4XIZ3_9CYAN